MNKDLYIKIAKNQFKGKPKKIVIDQIIKFYEAKQNGAISKKVYKIGDVVTLKKGTLLHGTYRNLEGLCDIVENGLIASIFTNGRISKYPSSVGVWNLKKDYKLKDYIKFYSGGTIKYNGLLINDEYSQKCSTDIISYDEMDNINKHILKNPCRMWTMEQTKEARFMPSLIQDVVQIGIIFNGDNKYTKDLLKGDILDIDNIDDKLICDFINDRYDVKSIVKDRHNKDDFFTDRESAIIFGLPSILIEGIIVGRKYEKDKDVLNEIKTILPNCYICNLDGIVIMPN